MLEWIKGKWVLMTGIAAGLGAIFGMMAGYSSIGGPMLATEAFAAELQEVAMNYSRGTRHIVLLSEWERTFTELENIRLRLEGETDPDKVMMLVQRSGMLTLKMRELNSELEQFR
tara:strand:+ start:4324 stop:4668 length:345 start_codon:yes stop_codon:yes gene_type:complete